MGRKIDKDGDWGPHDCAGLDGIHAGRRAQLTRGVRPCCARRRRQIEPRVWDGT